MRIQGVYRDQWNSFTNAYRTGSLNGEYKMPVGKGDDFMTVGGQMLFDKAGTVGLTTTSVQPALNYHKSLSSEKTMYLSLGFMGGMVRKSIDISKMTTDNQYGGGSFDPTAPTGETFSAPNFTSWDANVGMSFNTVFGVDNTNSLFIGAAYHHLNRPKNSFYRNSAIELNPKYVFSAGISLGWMSIRISLYRPTIPCKALLTRLLEAPFIPISWAMIRTIPCTPSMRGPSCAGRMR
jgi:type IX secretion system PorP/SprF family membrane protein